MGAASEKFSSGLIAGVVFALSQNKLNPVEVNKERTDRINDSLKVGFACRNRGRAWESLLV